MTAFPPTSGAQRAAQPTRIASWDNARFALIVLVVVGHMISTVRTDTAFGFALYAYIYLFHMPAMILLSGVFSKPEVTPKAIRSTIQLLGTWVLWEFIWVAIKALFKGQGFPDSFLVVPQWSLWFLLTLVTMRILLPFIARLRHPLAWSIALALLAGLSPSIGTEFSASRTLSFLPFFVAGWLIKDRGWLDGEWFRTPRASIRALGWSILGVVALAFAALPNLRNEWRIDKWLTWRDSDAWKFANAPLGAWQPESWIGTALGGVAVSALLLALAAALTFALLLVVPRSHSVMTTWGTRTLTVYLLHGVVVWFLRQYGVVDDVAAWGAMGMATLIVGAVLLSMLLSMRWVTIATQWVMAPNIDWLLKREPTAERT